MNQISAYRFTVRLFAFAPVLMSIFTGIARGESPLVAKNFVSETPTAGSFPLVAGQIAADIFVAPDDWKVAQITAGDLANDVKLVTGIQPALKHELTGLSSAAVLVGTIGKSPIIDKLIKDSHLDVSEVKGKWESYVIATVANPLPGVSQGLVIAGSDRRGTAYGVFELSRKIGVSPWVWWADVTPKHRDALHVSSEPLHVGPPAVKYRGIFINDEMWGIRPWAEKTNAPEEGHGLGPKTYARVFELLLRLRANYLWPAMQDHSIPFNCYPQNKIVADDYAIVMGSSHCEPMLRNNMAGAEWDREGGGEWDYQKNAAAVRDYWNRGLTANGKYENIYTLGMRGKDDEPMKFTGTKEAKIALMEKIFHDQREILAKHVNPDPVKVPQVFIPYTEVLGLYDSGMKVPDDVTICWPDDNFGYIRRLPTAVDRARSGGSGIYYHIQWLNGATTAYTWLNSTPPSLIWEEMHKAWRYDARELWILNVGDIKPGEIGIELFMQMACDPERWTRENIEEFLVDWAKRDLDEHFAPEIADIMEQYYQLGFTRRPEHLVQYRRNQPLHYSWFSNENDGDEAQRRMDAYLALAARAETVYQKMSEDRKDAFFELVLYPVKCAALINEKVICADKSTRAAAANHASAAEWAKRARAAAEGIIKMTEHYNTGLLSVGKKWNHMMSPAPGPWGSQFRQYDMPPLSDFAGEGPPALVLAAEGGHADVVDDLSVYTQGRRFIDLCNTGKGEIKWQASPSQPWLKLDEITGSFTAEKRLWISIDWEKAPKGADLKAAIEFTSNAGTERVTVPVFNPAAPDRNTVTGFVESHGYVSMEAEHFTRRHDHDGAAWQVVPGLGRSGDAVEVYPVTYAGPSKPTEPANIKAHSPAMDFDMFLFNAGECQLDLDCLPTLPVAPSHSVRLAISLDGGEPQIIRGKETADVLSNLRRWTTKITVAKPGRHVLTVWMVDPGVILDKLVLYTKPPEKSYLGPPESFHK